MAMYIGINGTPKEVSSLYVGVNGQAKEAVEVYGEDSGSVKLIKSSPAIPGETVFTSSGDFKLASSYTTVTAFLVGGGIGCGGFAVDITNKGGGSGYTKTCSISNRGSIYIAVGAGGAYHTAGNSYIGYEAHSIGGSYPDDLYEAVGASVYYNGVSNATLKDGSDFQYCRITFTGMDGGSGGGAGIYIDNSTYTYKGGDGGSDGGDGGYITDFDNSSIIAGGKGQGTTTRAFGESNGTLYAGGGGGGVGCGNFDTNTSAKVTRSSGGAGGGGNGGVMDFARDISISAENGATNTGGGGGGGWAPWDSDRICGGSGIVIIRYS